MEKPQNQNLPSQPLHSRVERAISEADQYAFNLQHEDGHWCGEFATAAFPTAEHILFRQSCELDLTQDAALFKKHLLSEQNTDGSWGIAPEHPGDVSKSVEVYLALRILGVDRNNCELKRARSFILAEGGVAKVQILTRIYLAQFGLIPWDAVPQLPAELIFLPAAFPLSIYTLWVPARITIVPLLIIRHHEPVHALPNGKSSRNDFIDELWLDTKNKNVPYGKTYVDLWRTDKIAFGMKAHDSLMHLLKGIRRLPQRYLARRKVVQWLLDHQNTDGTWCGFLTAYQFTVQALLLEGIKLQDATIGRALAAMETWMWQDESGKRIQLSNSPVWDTAMTMKAFCCSGSFREDYRIQAATRWCKNQQIFGKTDLNRYISNLPSGGFAFEYDNPNYPDVDDTAAVALAMLDQDPDAFEKYPLIRATEFVLAMQNLDGGWAAFDRNSNPEWLHKSPFNDMDNLCDPSAADITGRCLELCGLVIRAAERVTGSPPPDLVLSARKAVTPAIRFLREQQEEDGSWWGRWGINFVFGTCNAIGGLAQFVGAQDKIEIDIESMIQRGVAFLIKIQHPDGGWGESYATYDEPPAPPGSGHSLPSPTAWAVLALLTARTAIDCPAIERGIHWLLDHHKLTDGKGGKSWPERQLTGTGFPRKLYIGYRLYQHYFPMMALRHYLQARAVNSIRGSRAAVSDKT